MANQSILSAFERFWQHTVNALGTKADRNHTHDDYVKEDYDLVISLTEWDNLTKDHCEVISGSFSSVYEKYENGILPRVLLRRDFAYNSDCAVEYYESNCIQIGFNSNKYVNIDFDIFFPAHGIEKRQKINILSNGTDVDNNIITELKYVIEKGIYTAEIEFEMPFGSYPDEMAIEHFTYNSDDIKAIYDTLTHDRDTDFVKVLLKGVYYIASGSPYFVNIEPTNVYINNEYWNSGTGTNSNSVFINFVAKINGYRDSCYTLRFDRGSDGKFSLAQLEKERFLSIIFNVDSHFKHLSTSDVIYNEGEVRDMWEFLLENDNYRFDDNYKINVYGTSDLGSGGLQRTKLNVTQVAAWEYQFYIVVTFYNVMNYDFSNCAIVFEKDWETGEISLSRVTVHNLLAAT